MNLSPAERVNLAGVETSREVLSHSRLGTFLACEQRYRWQYVERLDQAVKPEPLSRGAAFATALELGDPDAGYAMVLADRDRMVEEHGANPWVSVPSADDALRVATIVRAASTGYLAKYGHTARREVTLQQRLRNPRTGAASRTFDVMARIDGLAHDVLIEDKFSSRVDTMTEQRLQLDRQTTLGAYLLWRCEGIDVREVSYRITKTPSIKQTQKEDLAGYLARMEQDYQDRPEFYFHEFRLTRTHEDFVRLEQELWEWAHQIRDAKTADVFPRNVSACADFGGCKYLPLCARQPGAIHQFVEREDYRPELPSLLIADNPKEMAA